MKYIILTIALVATITMLLWPNFHPEQAVFDKYYWQADIAIHSGYFFLLTLLLLNLKLALKPIHLALAIFTLSLVLEALQHFSFKRGASMMDLGSNFGGISLALVTYVSLLKKPFIAPISKKPSDTVAPKLKQRKSHERDSHKPPYTNNA